MTLMELTMFSLGFSCTIRLYSEPFAARITKVTVALLHETLQFASYDQVSVAPELTSALNCAAAA